jgi:hypothetical protein
MSKNYLYAWAAGIIDGEGSIMLLHRNKEEKRSPSISVSNTCLPILQELQKLFGGCICYHGKRKAQHAVAYSWRVSNDKALLCLQRIKPWLKHDSKIRRAELLLTTYKKVTVRNGKYSRQQLQAKCAFENKFLAL